jgi:hypothetical protein
MPGHTMPGRVRARRVIGRAVLALATVTTAMLCSGPAPAAPRGDEAVHTWSSAVTSVCVESHVDKAWAVKSAVRQWNRLPGGPSFHLEASCPDYEGTVTVRYQSSADRFTGWTDWYWDDSGHLVHADITLNPQRIAAFAGGDRSCMRKHTTSHELGHALGLRHYPHAHSGAVMSYQGWKKRCGRLDAHDRSDFAELYPAVVTVATTVA